MFSSMFTGDTEERVAKIKFERAVRRSALGSTLDLLIEGAPNEDVVTELSVLKAHKNLVDAIDDLVEAVVADVSSGEEMEKKKKLLEYLGMVEIGIKQFAETLEENN